MNKEERNTFRKEMLGKLEEQWAKSNSPEDDLFYYHPSEDKIVLSHALFWVMRRLQRLVALLQRHIQCSSYAPSKHVRFSYPLRCS